MIKVTHDLKNAINNSDENKTTLVYFGTNEMSNYIGFVNDINTSDNTISVILNETTDNGKLAITTIKNGAEFIVNDDYVILNKSNDSAVYTFEDILTVEEIL